MENFRSAAFNRRSLFKAGAAALAVGAFGAVAGQRAPLAQAAPKLGTILDYAAGVPSAASVKAAGHIGAIRYVSAKRPGAEWMTGKPVSLKETKDFAAHDLKTASIYQFGRAETADWKQGAAGAAVHAPQAIAFHKAAGGPTGRPIYIAIDDNPSRGEYDSLIRPYLKAFETALKAAGFQAGVYGNYNVVDWCVADGIGSFYWMHDWGSGGKVHPKAHIHQLPQGQQTKVDGVVADVNDVLQSDWGQWTPGQATNTPKPAPKPEPAKPAPKPQNNPAPTSPLDGLSSQLDPNSSAAYADVINGLANQAAGTAGVALPRIGANGITYNGFTVTNEQLKQAAQIAEIIAKQML